jgi:hypothetical protein
MQQIILCIRERASRQHDMGNTDSLCPFQHQIKIRCVMSTTMILTYCPAPDNLNVRDHTTHEQM